MINLLTNISSKTPIAMLPDVVNHNNDMIKFEIYPNGVTNNLPENLKSLCNEKGEILRSININDENTFKINHGEVTNDFSVYGKVITNGIVSKEITVNEKLNLSKTAITDFVNKYTYVFADIITNDIVDTKIDEALTKPYELYGGKNIIEIKINDYLETSGKILEIVSDLVNQKLIDIKYSLSNYIDEILNAADNSLIDEIFANNNDE